MWKPREVSLSPLSPPQTCLADVIRQLAVDSPRSWIRADCLDALVAIAADPATVRPFIAERSKADGHGRGRMQAASILKRLDEH